MYGRLGTVYFTTLCWACAGLALAQEHEVRISLTPRVNAEESRRASANLRLDVKVVLVPVTVSDSLDRPMTTLSRENFRVLEDGVEQNIESFSRDDGPGPIGVLFDTSRSMKAGCGVSLALKEVLETDNPRGRVFLVEFNDRARLANRFTGDPEDIYSRLNSMEPHGWTALFDAVALGANQMKTAKNRSRVFARPFGWVRQQQQVHRVRDK